ncbi:MAG: hypothetical protein LBI28_02850 [Treponema sp.]|jgi:predicted PilT family ATPase|nr:hypothetical protein [Treponema sp.]
MNDIEKIMIKRTEIMIEKYNFVKKLSFPEPKLIQIDNIQDYTVGKFKDDFSKLGDNIIYIIMTNEIPYTYKSIKEKFEELKKRSKKNYHISKINDEILWNRVTEEKIIYVGSKENNAINRFQQHFGIDINSRETYSLYLKDWWPNNMKLMIKLYQFGSKITSDILQIIEDLMWDEYLPLFGKKGATFNKKIKL